MDHSSLIILNQIGKGVYSKVFIGKVGDESYAVKSFKTDKKYLKSTKREMLVNEMMMEDKERPINIVKSFGSYFNKTYHLVFELMHINLLIFLKFYKEDMNEKLIIDIGTQITTGLEFIHKNFIHCDLKPENIMVDTETLTFKIIDFGLSFFITETEKHFHIQSSYYRAPEIVFRVSINPVIDVWSLGCIIYEMFSGSVLFRSVKNEELAFMFSEQFSNIPSIYGGYSKYLSYFGTSNPLFENVLKEKYQIDNVYRLKDTLEKHIKNHKVVDIIEKCLEPNYRIRIKSKELLQLFKNIS